MMLGSRGCKSSSTQIDGQVFSASRVSRVRQAKDALVSCPVAHLGSHPAFGIRKQAIPYQRGESTGTRAYTDRVSEIRWR
jgi:hypothetical protein